MRPGNARDDVSAEEEKGIEEDEGEEEEEKEEEEEGGVGQVSTRGRRVSAK